MTDRRCGDRVQAAECQRLSKVNRMKVYDRNDFAAFSRLSIFMYRLYAHHLLVGLTHSPLTSSVRDSWGTDIRRVAQNMIALLVISQIFVVGMSEWRPQNLLAVFLTDCNYL